MFNKVILVGNLTRDIELRYTPSGTAVGNTGIATSRKFKSADGQQKEEVCFVDLTFFGRTAEIANQYLRKGSKVLVEGRLKYDTWEDQNGGRRSKHSITVENMTMLDSKGSGPAGDQQGGGYGQQPSGGNYGGGQQGGSYGQQKSYQPPQQQNGPASGSPAGEKIPEIDIDDDEIPF
jgi:single-strand DNA-binding protein